MKITLGSSIVSGALALTAFVSCGEGDSDDPFGPSGGMNSAGGPGAGTIGIAGALSGGSFSMGGHAAGGTPAIEGGEGGQEPRAGAGGSVDSAGAGGVLEVAGSGGATEGGLGGAGGRTEGGSGGAGELGGAGGSAGEAGESAGGSGGNGAGSCGDGELSPAEMCCTPDWVEDRVLAVTQAWGEAAVGSTGCAPLQSQPGVQLCNSALCDGGEQGCRTEVLDVTVVYLPETAEVEGTMVLQITGRATLGIAPLQTACTFTSLIEDLEYRADLVTATTAEALTISIANLELDYTMTVSGCGALASSIAAFARTTVEPIVRQQLTETLRHTEACPF